MTDHDRWVFRRRGFVLIGSYLAGVGSHAALGVETDDARVWVFTLAAGSLVIMYLLYAGLATLDQITRLVRGTDKSEL